MQVFSILQVSNKRNFHSFRSKEQKNEKSVLSDDKIRYSLITLAAMATAGVTYKQLKPKAVEPIKTSTLQDLRSSLNKIEMQKLEEEYSKFDFSKFEIFNQLDITHQTDIFKRLFILLKMEPTRPVEIPKIIATNAHENELNNIADLFKKEFKFTSYEINYENSSLNEFLKELEQFSSKPDGNYKTLTINNFDKFLNDINQSGNEDFKKKFESLLDKNQENRTLYIIKEFHENKLNEYSKIFLKFNNINNRK